MNTAVFFTEAGFSHRVFTQGFYGLTPGHDQASLALKWMRVESRTCFTNLSIYPLGDIARADFSSGETGFLVDDVLSRFFQGKVETPQFSFMFVSQEVLRRVDKRVVEEVNRSEKVNHLVLKHIEGIAIWE